jgi:hypothetical protein
MSLKKWRVTGTHFQRIRIQNWIPLLQQVTQRKLSRHQNFKWNELETEIFPKTQKAGRKMGHFELFWNWIRIHKESAGNI